MAAGTSSRPSRAPTRITSAPRAVSRRSASAGASSVQMIQVGASRAVTARVALVGVRSRLSRMTRTGDQSSIPGRRTVSCGSSASTVPTPTMIASAWARIRCVRQFERSPVISRRAPDSRAA